MVRPAKPGLATTSRSTVAFRSAKGRSFAGERLSVILQQPVRTVLGLGGISPFDLAAEAQGVKATLSRTSTDLLACPEACGTRRPPYGQQLKSSTNGRFKMSFGICCGVTKWRSTKTTFGIRPAQRRATLLRANRHMVTHLGFGS